MLVAQAHNGSQTMSEAATIEQQAQQQAQQFAEQALSTDAGRKLAHYLRGLDAEARRKMQGQVLVFNMQTGDVLEPLLGSEPIQQTSDRYREKGIVAGFYRVT
jgi:hypothetical protein